MESDESQDPLRGEGAMSDDTGPVCFVNRRVRACPYKQVVAADGEIVPVIWRLLQSC